ncbi:Ornithine decarboxylase [Stygiomarasmius scandens]|uniref:ornithine decarboxylase n=1 Tax=Marasmiellus scandens TaxID=2682957 RepID=A0ABR1J2S4_9AGAR
MSQVQVLHPTPATHTLRVTADVCPSSARLPLNLFPDLPTLHTGHPSVHLRQGIIGANALISSADKEFSFPKDPTFSTSSQDALDGQSHGEGAFFVCDLSVVYQQHVRWMKALPGVRPFYAVKCNPDPYVLRLLASLGCGFDCASNGEITQVLSLNNATSKVDPLSSIIFANPCKPTSFILSSRRNGVQMMTFDNTDELYKIRKSYPQAKLVLRILTDSSKALCPLSLKFGAAMDTVPELLRLAKNLGLDVVGVSFHVGSGCYDPTVYTAAIRSAREVFDIAAQPENGGFEMDLLDIGGGFEDESFEDAAEVVRGALAEFFPEALLKPGETWVDHIGNEDKKKIKVIAEPGRFYVSRAFKLAACVIARRGPSPGNEDLAVQGNNTGEEVKPKVMYYINDGVYGAFNCILFDHQVVHPYILSLGGSFHVSSPDTTQSTPVLVPSSLWGPTCDSIDLICPLTYLPSTLAVGDWLGFDNMGAYTVCAASRFNGFDVSRVVYTVGDVGRDPSHAEEVLRALGKWAGAN